MDFYKENLRNLLKKFDDLFSKNIDKDKLASLHAPLVQFRSDLQKITSNVSFHFLTEEMKNYIDEAKANENLSQSEFEGKYSYEMEVCKQLGRAGWVVSEHSNPRVIKEWYDFLLHQDEKKISTYFEGNGCILVNILKKLEQEYRTAPYKIYYSNAKYYFDREEYMTSAMYLVSLIDVRINTLMNYPKNIRYNWQKYSVEGFGNHLQTEFIKTNFFFTKRFLFLDMYPSLIEFLNRLFVDGEYAFGKNTEPPYINRNWLLHGRSSRVIERYECIQLFNALSVVEFVFSISNRLN